MSSARSSTNFVRRIDSTGSIKSKIDPFTFSEPLIVSYPDFTDSKNSDFGVKLIKILDNLKGDQLRVLGVIIFLVFALVIYSFDHKQGFLRSLLLCVYLVIFFLLVIVSFYMAIPLSCLLIPKKMQSLIFQNFLHNPPSTYVDFESHKIQSMARNFHIINKKPPADEDEAPVLGVWHILPLKQSAEQVETEKMTQETMETLMAEDTSPIIVYFHGNTSDRAKDHRCKLYDLLSKWGYHVIVGDYRGYGDSTGHPTEDGIVRDALTIYDYVAQKCRPERKIIIWGHSMGTAISCHVTDKLCSVERAPFCVFLESPFSNLADMLREHPFAILYKWLPWFDTMIVEPLHRSGLRMESDRHIRRFKCPVKILHAADDHIIPIKLGRKLFEAAKEAGNPLVEFLEFPEEKTFKHCNIYQAPELQSTLTDFIAKSEAIQSKN